MKVITTARRRRFKRGNNKPKYGGMNKGFTEYEIKQFFKVIKNDKHCLLFQYQATLGLRVSEAVKINVKDINAQTRELKIYAPKTDSTDYLLIPEALFNSTLKYYEKHEKEVKDADGYLFFNGRSHINTNYTRKVFRDYCNKAGLVESYGMADESYRESRKLYRLTTHSLRHYAITRFYNATKDQQAAKVFARHSRSNTTDTYIHKTKEEVYRAIDLAFG